MVLPSTNQRLGSRAGPFWGTEDLNPQDLLSQRILLLLFLNAMNQGGREGFPKYRENLDFGLCEINWVPPKESEIFSHAINCQL